MAHRFAQNREGMDKLRTNWIFGTLRHDALWILFPGPLMLLLVTMLGPQASLYGLLLFITFAFLDSGHVYLTWWRTLFNPKERTRTRLYLIIPVIIILIFTTLFAIEYKYIWSLVLYSTAYHYIKQVIGFYHLYQRGLPKNKGDTFLFTLLMLLPFLAFHFRPDLTQSGFYTQFDLILYPSQELYRASLLCILVLQLLFLLSAARSYLKKNFQLSSTLYILIMSWFYILLFVNPQSSLPVVLASLIISHAIPYSKLIYCSLAKTKPIKIFNQKKNILIIILITLIILGGLEAFTEKYIIDFQRHSFSLIKSFIHGLYLVPLFFHFFFDGVIWKRKHHKLDY